ncbi:MAG: helix-turn-helix transcriptional regulator [Planctomycetes bacterium]|nr:helix-turn-helix transcriptional regulator [Planctomycetota bacterium]
MLPRDSSELVLLSLLADGPMYGYAISKEVGARSEGRMKLTPGVLYPLLRRMEAEGLVLTEWEEVKSERAQEGDEGRRRKWYKLSAKGRKALDHRIAAHRAYTAVLDAFIGPRGGGETSR